MISGEIHYWFCTISNKLVVVLVNRKSERNMVLNKNGLIGLMSMLLICLLWTPFVSSILGSFIRTFKTQSICYLCKWGRTVDHNFYNTKNFQIFLCHWGNWDIYSNHNGQCAAIAIVTGCKSTHFGDLRFAERALHIEIPAHLAELVKWPSTNLRLNYFP